MLAPAAADRALELDSVIHGLNGFCFFLFRKVLAFVFRFWSCCHLLLAGHGFGLDCYGPDEAQ